MRVEMGLFVDAALRLDFKRRTPLGDLLFRGRDIKDWQPHGHGGAFTQFAVHLTTATMQIDAALHDHQTETRPWTVTDVMPAVEGVEEPLPVGFWNSDPLVADNANNFCLVTLHFEPHHPAKVRILHGVG